MFLRMLTVLNFALLRHERQVNPESPRCESGVISCLSLPLVQSQTFRRPSGVTRAKKRPSLSNLQRQILLSIFHYFVTRAIHSNCANMACAL